LRIAESAAVADTGRHLALTSARTLADVAALDTHVFNADEVAVALQVSDAVWLRANEKRRCNTFLFHEIVCEAKEERLDAVGLQRGALSTEAFVAEDVRVAYAHELDANLAEITVFVHRAPGRAARAAHAAHAAFAASSAGAAGAITIGIGVEAFAVARAITALVVTSFHPDACDLSFAYTQGRAVTVEVVILAVLAVFELDDDIRELLA
jgi:hypothetical protein